jgi:hypothetical protein
MRLGAANLSYRGASVGITASLRPSKMGLGRCELLPSSGLGAPVAVFITVDVDMGLTPKEISDLKSVGNSRALSATRMGRRGRGSQVTVKRCAAHRHRRRDTARLRLRELDHYRPPGGNTSIGGRELELASKILLGRVVSYLEGGHRIVLINVPDDFAVTGRCGQLYD